MTKKPRSSAQHYNTVNPPRTHIEMTPARVLRDYLPPGIPEASRPYHGASIAMQPVWSSEVKCQLPMCGIGIAPPFSIVATIHCPRASHFGSRRDSSSVVHEGHSGHFSSSLSHFAYMCCVWVTLSTGSTSIPYYQSPRG